MKLHDIKIGNYLNRSKTTCLGHEGVFLLDGYEFNKILDHGFKYIEPIKLTEEWILKFKEFGKLEEKKYFNGDNIMILCDNDVFIVYSHDECTGEVWYIKRIHFVHQLQNIVWILTGNELTIKTK